LAVIATVKTSHDVKDFTKIAADRGLCIDPFVEGAPSGAP
jgi:hypothetical protein